MWFALAITAPVLYAVVHLIDEHCIDEVFADVYVATMVSAFVSLAILLLAFPAYAPMVNFAEWSWVWLPVCAAVLSGGLVAVSHALYFTALERSEAGIVAAYWNMIPVLVLLGSAVVFREVLVLWQYMGIVLLTAAAVSFSVLDAEKAQRKQTLFIMIAACFIQAASYLVDEYVYREMAFSQGFFLTVLGLAAVSFLPLLLRVHRVHLREELPKLRPFLGLFFLAECVYLVALLCAERAIDIGVPSLVSALETAIPGFTFLLCLALFYMAPRYVQPQALAHLPAKFGLVGVMCLGAWLIQ